MDKKTGYDICRCCYQRKKPRHGCFLSYVRIKKSIFKRIKVGSALSIEADTGKVKRDYLCKECNAGKGQYHHYGCKMERCPFCTNQLVGCRCNAKYQPRKYFRRHFRRLMG